MTDRKPQDQDKFVLRLPDGMRDRIKAAADSNNRSMNAEIVATLEKAYPEPKPANDHETIVAQVLADGKSRVLKKDDSETHFSLESEGRVVLTVIDKRRIR